jgi:hypothetical protein
MKAICIPPINSLHPNVERHGLPSEDRYTKRHARIFAVRGPSPPSRVGNLRSHRIYPKGERRRRFLLSPPGGEIVIVGFDEATRGGGGRSCPHVVRARAPIGALEEANVEAVDHDTAT